VKSGVAKSVLLVGVEKLADQHGKTVQDYLARGLSYRDYLAGLMPVHYAALMMKKYMETYGVSYDYFTNWPVKMHLYASENPLAMLKFKVTPEQVKESSVISDPIRLYDTGARGDGAAAVLLTSDDLARKYSDEVVKLETATGSSGDLEVSVSSSAVRSLSLKLGDSLKDYYLQIHDSYSVTAAIELEDLGVLPRGRSLNEIDSIEVNFEGGLKARGYPGGATAVYQLAESYLQLTHKFKGKKTTKERALILSTDELLTAAYGIKVVRA
jgi:acetyl-CoA C-acetyltransferase